MKASTLAATMVLALVTPVVVAAPASADPFCGLDVRSPGATVTLTSDVFCDGTAITVNASNVTIDLAGFTISGTATDPGKIPAGGTAVAHTSGVTVASGSNAVVRGGTIEGFDIGVIVATARGVVLTELAIESPARAGIWVEDSTNVTVEKSTLTGTWTRGGPTDDGYDRGEHGIAFMESFGAAVSLTTIRGFNGNGIHSELTQGLTAQDVDASQNAGSGIYVWQSTASVGIYRTTLNDNVEGLSLYHVTDAAVVTLDTVSALRNTENGVKIWNMRRCLLTRVTASDNGVEGVWLDSRSLFSASEPYRATVVDSIAQRNRGDGIALAGTGTWYVSGSLATDNAKSGFYFSGGTATYSGGTVTSLRNTATSNGTEGFYWDTGARGTSTSDVAGLNGLNGLLVKSGTATNVTVTGLKSSMNRSHGMLVSTGAAIVERGSFWGNSRDGIRVTSGTARVRGAATWKNGGNGVAFLSTATGEGSTITSTSNGRYGLCVARSARYTDIPPHVLTGNTLGSRGSTCDPLLPFVLFP